MKLFYDEPQAQAQARADAAAVLHAALGELELQILLTRQGGEPHPPHTALYKAEGVLYSTRPDGR